MRGNFKQGLFKPRNPQKYKGARLDQIVYRSGWELQLFNFCDTQSQIVEWSSEDVVVPYRSPIDNKVHRYFVDVWVKTIKGEEILVEIKPFSQCQAPIEPSRKTASYKQKVADYLVNQAKWAAAKSYCETKGWQFKVLTEHDLGIKR